MPPDSEKSRPSDDSIVSMRTSISSSTIDTYTSTTTNTKVDSDNDSNNAVDNMKLYKDVACLLSNEICIDGIVYDVNTFENHPGGTIFKSYAGNDCSIQYRYMHATHNTQPGLVHKLLDKNMQRVGIIVNYQPEYKFGTPFERELKQEVLKLVKGKDHFATNGFFFRAFIFIAMYCTSSYYWTTTTNITYTLVMIHALSSGLLALNVSHDANHGTISGKYPWMNSILAFGVDLIGSNKWLWQQSHGGHHAYTNTERDPDSIATEPAILFNPYPIGSPKRHWIQNFQVLYVLPMASLYWLSLVFNPEVVSLKEHTAVLTGFKLENDFLKVRRKYATLVRLLYIYVYVIRVLQNNGCNWDTISKILLMGCLGSMVLAKALFNHNFDECNRDNLNELDTNGELQDWCKKQVESSSTYGGYIAGALSGGLNYQIEHHMFPRMNSAWYPTIAPTVRAVCEKHNVHYAFFPTILHQFISFSKFVHQSGTGTLERQWDKKID